MQKIRINTPPINLSGSILGNSLVGLVVNCSASCGNYRIIRVSDILTALNHNPTAQKEWQKYGYLQTNVAIPNAFCELAV